MNARIVKKGTKKTMEKMEKKQAAAVNGKPKGKYPTEWNLGVYYSGINDPKITKDIEENKKIAVAFEKKHRGKIKSYSESQLVSLFDELNAMYIKMYPVGTYVGLLSATDSKDPVIISAHQQIELVNTEIRNHFVFFNIELGQHPKLKKYSESKKFGSYLIVLQGILDTKKYQLSHKEEVMSNIKSVSSSDGWVKLFEQTWAQKSFEFKLRGKKTKNE